MRIKQINEIKISSKFEFERFTVEHPKILFSIINRFYFRPISTYCWYKYTDLIDMR